MTSLRTEHAPCVTHPAFLILSEAGMRRMISGYVRWIIATEIEMEPIVNHRLRLLLEGGPWCGANRAPGY